MTQSFFHVEMEINTNCDCSCFGCDRFLDAAPTTPMTVEQVQQFVREAIDQQWHWKRIHVLGGEPTLHKQFRDIVRLLIDYRKLYPGQLTVISNGLGNLSNHQSWLEDNGVRIAVEAKSKTKTPEWFCNTRQAPIDEGILQLPPCSIYGAEACGIGFTKHGYFLCGAGASIARVTGQDIGTKRLQDLSHESMLQQAKTLCHLCGHYSGPERQRKLIANTGDVAGPYWANKLRDWKPSHMSLYGVD